MSIRLDRQLLARLERAAAQAHQPVSTVARAAIAAWLDRHEIRRAEVLLGAAGTVAGKGQSATGENVRAAFRKARR